MKKLNLNFIVIIGAVIVILCALIFSFSAKSFSDQGKYVEVKGLAERVVKADVATWSLSFDVKSNDGEALYGDINKNIGVITDFLVESGFEKSEISVAPINTYQDTYEKAMYRFNSNVSLSLYTDKVDLVREVSQNTLPLIEKGVILGYGHINYEFTGLNDIKPEMLEEAISNARISAEKFAEDSGVSVGTIARANQGVFSINEKDPASPEYKKVRVVSTLRYLLK